MDWSSFSERWARKELELGYGEISKGMAQFDGMKLPRDAAPCLSFDDFERQPRICDRYGSRHYWSEADKDRLGIYRVIGFEGAGNPLCVEESTGIIWELDHEDNFRTRRFVNSDLPSLAECLLAYMGESDAEKFGHAVLEIDAPALADGTFWWSEKQQIFLDEP